MLEHRGHRLDPTRPAARTARGPVGCPRRSGVARRRPGRARRVGTGRRRSRARLALLHGRRGPRRDARRPSAVSPGLGGRGLLRRGLARWKRLGDSLAGAPRGRHQPTCGPAPRSLSPAAYRGCARCECAAAPSARERRRARRVRQDSLRRGRRPTPAARYALPPWPLLASERLAAVYAALSGLLLAAAAWSAAARGHEGRRAGGGAARCSPPSASPRCSPGRTRGTSTTPTGCTSGIWRTTTSVEVPRGSSGTRACTPARRSSTPRTAWPSPTRRSATCATTGSFPRRPSSSAHPSAAARSRRSDGSCSGATAGRSAASSARSGGPRSGGTTASTALRRGRFSAGRSRLWRRLPRLSSASWPPRTPCCCRRPSSWPPPRSASRGRRSPPASSARTRSPRSAGPAGPSSATTGCSGSWPDSRPCAPGALPSAASRSRGQHCSAYSLSSPWPASARRRARRRSSGAACWPITERWRVAAGAALAVALLGVLPAVVSGRPGIWMEFARNSARHLDHESANSVGLATFLSYDAAMSLDMTRDPLLVDTLAAWTAGRTAARRATAPARWAAVGAFALLLIAASRRLPDWAAAVLGLGLMPIAFNLSSYYYSAFLAFGLLWAVRRAPGVGLALLAVATNLLAGFYPAADARFAVQSLAVVSFVVAITAALALEREPPAARLSRRSTASTCAGPSWRQGPRRVNSRDGFREPRTCRGRLSAAAGRRSIAARGRPHARRSRPRWPWTARPPRPSRASVGRSTGSTMRTSRWASVSAPSACSARTVTRRRPHAWPWGSPSTAWTCAARRRPRAGWSGRAAFSTARPPAPSMAGSPSGTGTSRCTSGETARRLPPAPARRASSRPRGVSSTWRCSRSRSRVSSSSPVAT